MNRVTEATAQSLALVGNMPIFYSGLVVENTTRCNARCAMCYQSAGPKGSDTWGHAALTTDEIKNIITQAVSVETLHPRFHLSGGEAFLQIDACLDIFRHAHSCGFLDITTTTNAYWATQADRAQQVCEQLRLAGLTSMEISWDFWHLPFIRPQAIENCLSACAEFDIETNLRILSTKSHSYQEALAALDVSALNKACRISGGPVFATGRAKEQIEATDFHQQNSIDGNCHSVLNLTVNALGNVYPCCAGLDQTDKFIFGNVRDRTIHEIVDAMNRSPLVRMIVFSGIASLIPILERSGIDIGRQYNGICHLCWSIFSRADCVHALEEYLEAANQRALRGVLQRLEASLAESSA